MKKILLLGISFFICTSISAQLSVESTGKVNVQSTGNQLPTILAIGSSSGTYSGYKYGTTIHFTPVPSYRSMGIYSRTVSSNYLGASLQIINDGIIETINGLDASLGATVDIIEGAIN